MNEAAPAWRLKRVVILMAAVLLVGALVWLLRVGGPSVMPWSCLLHDFTGLHCPGCGMTRAASAILEGDFWAALRFNLLGMILLPVALVALIPEAIGWLRESPPPWRFPLGKRGAWVLVWVVISFAVLRNVPVPPFVWLAPTP